LVVVVVEGNILFTMQFLAIHRVTRCPCYSDALSIVMGQFEGMQSDSQNCGFHFFQAWKLWIEDRSIELIDELLGDLCTLSNVLRHIHVGLLCVQQKPEDRPTMSSVVQMLSSESSLPKPRQPGFFTDSLEADPLSRNHATCSANGISISSLEAR
jgi:hypothetical protein